MLKGWLVRLKILLITIFASKKRKLNISRRNLSQIVASLSTRVAEYTFALSSEGRILALDNKEGVRAIITLQEYGYKIGAVFDKRDPDLEAQAKLFSTLKTVSTLPLSSAITNIYFDKKEAKLYVGETAAQHLEEIDVPSNVIKGDFLN